MSNPSFEEASCWATNEPLTKEIGRYKYPEHWWSRPFEYRWASQWLNPNDDVLDAGAGGPHPLKYHIADICQSCCAMDNVDIAAESEPRDNMSYLQHDMLSSPYPLPDESFDKVVCVSVLEHLPADGIATVLSEFARVLKDGGLAVITMDVPRVTVDDWVNLVGESSLNFVVPPPPVPENVLVGNGHAAGLTILCSLLRK